MSDIAPINENTMTLDAPEAPSFRHYSSGEAIARVVHAAIHTAEAEVQAITVRVVPPDDKIAADYDEATNKMAFEVAATLKAPGIPRVVVGMGYFNGSREEVVVVCNGFDSRPVPIWSLND